MSAARDEVLWLCLHQTSQQRPRTKAKFNFDLLADESLGELLFLATRVEGLVIENIELVKRYVRARTCGGILEQVTGQSANACMTGKSVGATSND